MLNHFDSGLSMVSDEAAAGTVLRLRQQRRRHLRQSQWQMCLLPPWLLRKQLLFL